MQLRFVGKRQKKNLRLEAILTKCQPAQEGVFERSFASIGPVLHLQPLTGHHLETRAISNNAWLA